MKGIEDILTGKYGLGRTAIYANGPRCIVAQNYCMMATVAAPGHFDTTGKWIVRFMPLVARCIPGGLGYFNLGAMLEERFDSEDECIEYLQTQETVIYKKLYFYALDVINNLVKSKDELESLDPTNRGEFLEVLK